MKNDRGSISVQVAIITCIFLFMFTATYKNILKSNNFNELQRRAEMVSQNKLMSYDRYLFNDFGILAYLSEDFQGLWKDQATKSKWSGIETASLKLKKLSEGDELEKQVKKLVRIRVPYEIISNENMQEGGLSKPDMEDINPSYMGAVATGNEKLNLTEYVVSTMSDRVISKGRETSLFAKEENHPYMKNAQVEYIITGNNSSSSAQNSVYRRIFVIRELVNTKYIMSCEEDMIIIRAEAAAAVAASEGALPYPVAEKLAIAAMATSRSKTDMDYLLNGDYISVDASPRSGKIKKVYYDDFLRLLLLAVSHDDIKNRIFHIIEGNIYEQFGADITLANAYVGHSFSLVKGGKELARADGEYFDED